MNFHFISKSLRSSLHGRYGCPYPYAFQIRSFNTERISVHNFLNYFIANNLKHLHHSYQIKQFVSASSASQRTKASLPKSTQICSNRQKKLPQYSQSKIDLYFAKGVIQDYWKKDVVSIMTNVNKSGGKLSIDKHLDKICEFFKISSEKFSSGDVSAIIYSLSNIIDVKAEPKIYDALISEITKKLSQTTQGFTIVNISSTFMGLKSMTSSSAAVCELLKVLASKIDTCKDSFNVQALSNSFYGLQNMSSTVLEVKQLLDALVPKVQSCKQPMSAQSVSNALYGLQNMSSSDLEVPPLLSALIPKIESCIEPFNKQALGNTLYGLQNMNSDNVEVRRLLKVLAPMVESCSEPLNEQEVGMVLYGLQNMNSDCLEVLQILRVLAPKIESCNEPLSSQAAGNVLYGIKNMSSDCIEVQGILKVLAQKIQLSPEPFNSQAIGNILYSVQNMNSENTEVQCLLNALIPRIELCNERLSIQSLTTALYGLQNMKVIPIRLIQYLEKELSNLYSLLKTSTLELDNLDALCLYQSIILCCSNHEANENHKIPHNSIIYDQLSESGHQSINELKSLLKEYLKGPEILEFIQSLITSKVESKYVKIIEKQLLLKFPREFKNGEATIEKNVLLRGFECDMVLRYKKNIIVNFEIDGSSHMRHSKISFCKKRDTYLDRAYGIKVVRYDVIKNLIKLTWKT